MSEKKYQVEFVENLGYILKGNGFNVVLDKKYQAYKVCDELNKLYEIKEKILEVIYNES